jgi:hypothetical protein
MAVGTSIFLIAAGAILKYAVTVEISGVELETVGVILMAVGLLGLVVSLIFLFAANDRRDVPRVPPDDRRY